ncbi:MAG: NAD-dependent epimerase/dehydratase family protein [Marinibacterium sp.]
MKYLVTGAAGFIGSHLCDRLIAGGHEVLGIDNMSTGRRENIDGSGVELVEADIVTHRMLGELIAEADAVIHLAAVSSVQAYMSDWAAAARVNLIGSLRVFEAAAAADVPVVYASSAAIYGDTQMLPIDETTPGRPISGYGTDKFSMEKHAAAMRDSIGLSSIGLRFFNVFGPRQDPGSPYSGVITLFIRRFLEGQPLTVFGDGTQTRDFIYVEDVAEAILRASARCRTAPRGAYNVCTGRSCSINDLAGVLARVRGHSVPVDYAPPRANEILHSRGSASAASADLGFAPKWSLEDGLAETVGWFAGEPEKVRA